jgi:hypothetical protein
MMWGARLGGTHFSKFPAKNNSKNILTNTVERQMQHCREQNSHLVRQVINVILESLEYESDGFHQTLVGI